MTYRIAAVLILTLLAAGLMHAQVDSFGGTPIKPWGIWRPLSPKSPYLESRVQCDFESKENGRVTSTWDYEIRSRYKHTIDFAYKVELASFELQRENQTVTFKVDSFDSGAKYANYTVLFGGCSQHMTAATGVHFWLRCLVPTGEPCSENGSQVLADSADIIPNAFPDIAAKRGGTGTGTSKEVGAQSNPAKKPTATYDGYGVCYAQQRQVLLTKPFSTKCTEPISSNWSEAKDSQCGMDMTRQFFDFARDKYGYGNTGECFLFNNTEEAGIHFREIQENAPRNRLTVEVVDWLPAGGTPSSAPKAMTAYGYCGTRGNRDIPATITRPFTIDCPDGFSTQMSYGDSQTACARAVSDSFNRYLNQRFNIRYNFQEPAPCTLFSDEQRAETDSQNLRKTLSRFGGCGRYSRVETSGSWVYAITTRPFALSCQRGFFGH